MTPRFHMVLETFKGSLSRYKCQTFLIVLREILIHSCRIVAEPPDAEVVHETRFVPEVPLAGIQTGREVRRYHHRPDALL